MSYNYRVERPKLFTEEGMALVLKIRNNVDAALKAAGAVSFGVAMRGCAGDSFTIIAAVDYLVERGELKEVTNGAYVWKQHSVYVRGEEWGK